MMNNGAARPLMWSDVQGGGKGGQRPWAESSELPEVSEGAVGVRAGRAASVAVAAAARSPLPLGSRFGGGVNSSGCSVVGPPHPSHPRCLWPKGCVFFRSSEPTPSSEVIVCASPSASPVGRPRMGGEVGSPIQTGRAEKPEKSQESSFV